MKKGSRLSKIILFLVIFCLVFSLSSCKSNKGNFKTPAHKGKEGIRMSLYPNSPRSKITASTGQEFNIELKIENKGAAPTKGHIYLSGLDPDIVEIPNLFTFPNSCGVGYLRGKSKSYPGDICVESIRGLLNLNPVIDTYPGQGSAKLQVRAVYEYYTDAEVGVCVDSNYNQLGKKPCQMRTVTLSGGQGGPVAITKVEPISLGRGRIQFNIHIKNVGRGDVVNIGKRWDELSPMDFNRVYYRIMVPGQVTPLTGYSISGANIGYEGNRVSYGDNRFEILIGGGGAGYMPGFSSAGVGGARLDENGRGVIPVTVDFGQEFNSYKTSLRVTLFYGYTEYIERPIRIYKVPDPQVDMLYPDFGFSGNQMLYPTGTHGYKYFGYHEDPFGHDVWRYVDGNKNLDIQIITT